MKKVLLKNMKSYPINYRNGQEKLHEKRQRGNEVT